MEEPRLHLADVGASLEEWRDEFEIRLVILKVQKKRPTFSQKKRDVLLEKYMKSWFQEEKEDYEIHKDALSIIQESKELDQGSVLERFYEEQEFLVEGYLREARWMKAKQRNDELEERIRELEDLVKELEKTHRESTRKNE